MPTRRPIPPPNPFQAWVLTFLLLLGGQYASAEANVVVNLGQDNFTSVLAGVVSDHPYALVEFYASWCPACRAFMPEYEKVATFFLDEKVHDQKVFVGRVDCATEVALCGSYNLSFYPTVTFSKPQDYVDMLTKVVHRYDGHRTAKAVVAWVAKMTSATIDYHDPDGKSKEADVKVSTPTHLVKATGQANTPGTTPFWELADVEAATMQLYNMIMDNPVMSTGSVKRNALLTLVRWWAATHPSDKCQSGAQKLVAFFSMKWPESEESAPDEMKNFQICGMKSRPEYNGCKGSTPEARGFTCGLWILFHTSALRIPPSDGVSLMTDAVVAFNEHFFMCAQCQEHFSKVLDQPAFKSIATPEDLSLWLWITHNQVNARLAQVEKEYGHSTSGDPAFTKSIWPSKVECPRCWADGGASEDPATLANIDWNKEEIMRWLNGVYGDASAPALTQSVAAKSQILRKAEEDSKQQQQVALGRLGGLSGRPAISSDDVDKANHFAHIRIVKLRHHLLFVLVFVAISVGFGIVALMRRPVTFRSQIFHRLGGHAHGPDS